jgi:uncharacterized protein
MFPDPMPFEVGESERVALGPGGIPALRLRPAGASTPLPCIVLQHGYGADKYDLEPVAETLAGLGFAVVLPDAWGHGERLDPRGANWMAFGTARGFVEILQRVADELEQIAGWVRDDPAVQADRLILGGFSMGGIASILVTERNPQIAGLIAIAGGVDAQSLGQRLGGGGLDAARQTWASANDMAAPERARLLAPRPILLMHGRRDDRLPVEGSIHLHAAALPAYEGIEERLRLRLYDATHEITLSMMTDALAWLSEFFGA